MTMNTSYKVIRGEKGLEYTGNCLWCNSIFFAKTRKKKFCGASCREIFGRERRKGNTETIIKKQTNHSDSDFDKFIETISLQIKQAARENNEIKMNTLQRQKDLFISNNQRV